MKPKPSAISTSITRYQSDQPITREDLLAVEEPMEIRLCFEHSGGPVEKAVSITMRTPGNDFELAAGYLFTEGIVTGLEQIKMIRHCIDTDQQDHPENIVKVDLTPGVDVDLDQLKRNFYMTSSCGICGKASIEQVQTTSCFPVLPNVPKVGHGIINQLPETLRKQQTVFKHTGGIHAAALFDPLGNLLLMREDIGRHNAVDKLIGSAVINEMVPLSKHIILFSGRASFELVQKSAMAGIPIMAAVGAPSSLAVETAVKFGMTLCGFVKADRFNVYAGTSRII